MASSSVLKIEIDDFLHNKAIEMQRKLGLNNAEHYENGNNLASKCKIIFNASTAQQAKQTKQSAPVGCCTISGNATMPNTTENSCTTDFGGIGWIEGQCP